MVAYLKSSFRRMDFSTNGSIARELPTLTPDSSVTRTGCCLVSAFAILNLILSRFYLYSLRGGIPPYIPPTLYTHSTLQPNNTLICTDLHDNHDKKHYRPLVAEHWLSYLIHGLSHVRSSGGWFRLQIRCDVIPLTMHLDF